jgi:F0F1-type ATP synthase assembly protein I
MRQRPVGIMVFAQLGLLNALCLLGGMAAGWGVDRWLGTLPLFLFVGLVIGIGVGAYLTWREVKDYS